MTNFCMTKPGPKKTPVAKLKRHRTYRPGRHAEPTKRSGTRPSDPKPPAGLSKEARTIWKQFAGRLVKHDLLTDISLPVFEIFCESLAEFRFYRDHLKKAGDRFVKMRNGKKIQSPVVGMMDRAAKKVLDCAAHLGMRSGDRPDLDPNSGAVGALEEFLNRAYGIPKVPPGNANAN